MTDRIVRPSQLPEQRGPQHARALARPGVRPPSEGAPRPARRALPASLSGVADSVVGFVIVVLVVAATVVALGLVGAAWLGVG